MPLWPRALGEGHWPVYVAWTVALSELVGGAAVLLGLFTRLLALVLAYALEPAEGFAVTERLGLSTPTVKGNHGQLPTRPGLQTGFIAEGAGIRPGAVIPRMKLVDIAPAVAELLQLDLPGTEGRTPAGLLR